jgi:SNF2 family DNA or RNA helicase
MLISLRAGAGMDGLQNICHVVVKAELDWSPGVHKQFVGRVHRDGQDDPVTVYWVLSDKGSDPVMSEVLGIKTQQIEGIINPNQELVTELQVDEDYIKKMAQAYLLEHGVDVTKET